MRPGMGKRGGLRIIYLSGLWFNDAEIHALLSMEQLLSSIQPGLLGERIKPLRESIQQLIGTAAYSADAIGKRILISHQSAPTVDIGLFLIISNALMAGRRLRIAHHNRRSGDTVTHDVSPHRLLHYRENWYLNAWCHLRDDLRRFSIPWRIGIAGPQRVIFARYDKTAELRFRTQLTEFELATRDTGHHWLPITLHCLGACPRIASGSRRPHIVGWAERSEAQQSMGCRASSVGLRASAQPSTSSRTAS